MRSKGGRTSEKRLILAIAVSKDGYWKHDILNNGFVRAENNLADGLTNEMQRDTLRNVLDSGTNTVKVDLWIVRPVNCQCSCRSTA